MFAVAYTVKFQKRGLPHVHIVLWLAKYYRCHSTEEIDFIISAEIPEKNSDPVGFEAVTTYMVHGPCSMRCCEPKLCLHERQRRQQKV